MLKLPEEQSASPRKLVLGYDAGCMACSDLASKIEERVGDKLEVRSLHDPQVEHWRQQALGEDAPWTPTLFEVGGTKQARAWTGVGMAVRLAGALGPVSTWRVMQALGEVGERKVAVSAAGGSSVAGMAAAGMSRGQFLKGVGGAAVALGILSGVGSPAQAATKQELNRDALVAAFSKIEQIPDSVARQGERASKEWLRRSVQEDTEAGVRQTKNWYTCGRAVIIAILTNAIPVLRIRTAVRALGGAYRFGSFVVNTFYYLRGHGYSYYAAIRRTAYITSNRVLKITGVDVLSALLGLFSLTSVRDNCFA